MFSTLSHPARGAWIEMIPIAQQLKHTFRRTPQGVRGLKFRLRFFCQVAPRRTPHGVRGLKYLRFGLCFAFAAVAPRMGCVD